MGPAFSNDDPRRQPSANPAGPENDGPTIVALSGGQTVFSRYELEVIAGRGGMGVVWRARDRELERTVALKFLPEMVASDPEAVKDLKSETRRCLQLTHPHIVRVHDFVQEGTLAAISMEFVAGASLAQRKTESPHHCLTRAELAPLVVQLCDALDYAHQSAHVVHRDLKPANLLVSDSGQLKVTDFGIARSLTETHTRLTSSTRGTSGTLLYMSPQQLMGDNPTPADDLYALGATLYELLAGKPPFHRGDGFSLMTQIREKTPLPIAAKRAELGIQGEPVPPEWESALLACLEKEPAQRPASARDVAARMGLVHGTPPTSRWAVPPPPTLVTSLAPDAADAPTTAPFSLPQAAPVPRPAAWTPPPGPSLPPPPAPARPASSRRYFWRIVAVVALVLAACRTAYWISLSIPQWRAAAEQQRVETLEKEEKVRHEAQKRRDEALAAAQKQAQAQRDDEAAIAAKLAENDRAGGAHETADGDAGSGEGWFHRTWNKVKSIDPGAAKEAGPPPEAKTATAPADNGVPGMVSSPPRVGASWTVPTAALRMAWIRPGTFTMGSPPEESDREDNEGPATRVKISQGFWLGATPVTRRQWSVLMAADPSNYRDAATLDAPVEQVSWIAAMAYCRRLTEREKAAGRLPAGYVFTLPTEAQWEYACRAGTTGSCYASPLDLVAWYEDDRGVNKGPHPVGLKKPNAWGLSDMLGNVFQLCRGWNNVYPGGDAVDNPGALAGDRRVARGGSWSSRSSVCRAAYRLEIRSGSEEDNVGFRVALAPP